MSSYGNERCGSCFYFWDFDADGACCGWASTNTGESETDEVVICDWRNACSQYKPTMIARIALALEDITENGIMVAVDWPETCAPGCRCPDCG